METSTPLQGENFLLEGLQRFLPTFDLLFKRKIRSNADCPYCRYDIEDVNHALFDWSFAVEIWDECRIGLNKNSIGQSDFLTRIFEMQNFLNKDDFRLALVVM